MGARGPTCGHVDGEQRLRRVEAPNVQTVDVRDSADRQQLLSHAVGTGVPRSSCTENVEPQHLQKGPTSAGKASAPSISIRKASLVTGKVVPSTRAENRNVHIGSAALYSGCEEHKKKNETGKSNRRWSDAIF